MANDICVRFGRRLQQAREKKGLKQIDLAEHTGIARTYISKLENGRTEICLKRLDELAIALDMKPWELLKGVKGNTVHLLFNDFSADESIKKMKVAVEIRVAFLEQLSLMCRTHAAARSFTVARVQLVD